MDRKIFFDCVRPSLFGDKLTQEQVSGMNNLLNVWDQHFSGDMALPNPTDYLAYNLATAYHETAKTMQPITERGPISYFNKYEPEMRIGKILGNTQRGDGFRYRGEGHVQNTGRRNAKVATDRLNELFDLGIDLVANPDQRGDPFVSAMSLFLGNKEGWWTGKKLSDYLKPGAPDFNGARRVINGMDKSNTIAGYAKLFKAAIQKAAA